MSEPSSQQIEPRRRTNLPLDAVLAAQSIAPFGNVPSCLAIPWFMNRNLSRPHQEPELMAAQT
jgi:hypothetical protein